MPLNQQVTGSSPVGCTEKLLKSIGYEILFLEDKTEISAQSFQNAIEKIQCDGEPPLGLNFLMGKNTMEKLIYTTKNLTEKRITVLRGIYIKQISF